MAESFENLDTILHDWAKDKVQKSFVEALKRYERQKKNDKAVLWKMTQKNYSSSLSR